MKWTSRKRSVLERVLLLGGYIQITLMFGVSIWSGDGEFLFSAIALLIIVALLIDALREYGVSGLHYHPLGRTFYIYLAALVSLSVFVNAVVYIRFLFVLSP